MTTQTDWLPLSDPDMSLGEIEAITEVLKSPRFSPGAVVEAFEAAFAVYIGRRHAVAVPSGTLGLVLALRASGIGRGDEVIAPAYAWHQIAHAIALVDAAPGFADIDYWSGTLAPEKAAEKVADRAVALPLHAHLTEDEVAFIVKTAKDASVNVGAGSAIYL